MNECLRWKFKIFALAELEFCNGLAISRDPQELLHLELCSKGVSATAAH
jgi:hypothetical protein